jgi:hypothetical protein
LQKKYTRVRIESSDDEDGKEPGDDRDALARELFDSEDEEPAEERDQVPCKTGLLTNVIFIGRIIS